MFVKVLYSYNYIINLVLNTHFLFLISHVHDIQNDKKIVCP